MRIVRKVAAPAAAVYVICLLLIAAFTAGPDTNVEAPPPAQTAVDDGIQG